MTPDFRTYLVELLAGLGPVKIRRVFNLDGLYLGETMFGLVAENRLYLKTGDQNRKDFEREGSAPLRYTAPNKEPIVMSYWELPARLHDEPEELVAWTKKACEAARDSFSAKRKRARAEKYKSSRQPVSRRSRS